MYTDPSGCSADTSLTSIVTDAKISARLATAVVFHDQVMLNIFLSMRRNVADATVEQTCTVLSGDWKSTILGFPAHQLDNRWIVTKIPRMLWWKLFEAIYATDVDRSIPGFSGIPADEQDNSIIDGIPAQERNGSIIYESRSNAVRKPDLDIVKDSYLKKKGIDPHKLKKDIYGKKAKVSEYDIYVDKKTGQLYTQRKPQYNKKKEPAIPTGEYIK